MRLSAIQNLGAMDVLCTDKTGTLTMEQVILERHCDVMLRESDHVLSLAYLNSHFQTGVKNVLDRAILTHTETHAHAFIPDYAKIDEIPFDLKRRIMSVVVRTPDIAASAGASASIGGQDRIISKGAPEASVPTIAPAQTVLETVALTPRFGDKVAVDDVSRFTVSLETRANEQSCPKLQLLSPYAAEKRLARILLMRFR